MIKNNKKKTLIFLIIICILISATIYYVINKKEYPACFMYNDEKYIISPRPCEFKTDRTIVERRNDVDTYISYVIQDNFDIEKSGSDMNALTDFIDNQYSLNIDGARLSDESIYTINNVKPKYDDVVENFDAYGFIEGDSIYLVENSSGYDTERLVVKLNKTNNKYKDYPDDYMYLYKLHDDRFTFVYW